MSDDFDDNRSAGAALAASIELDKDKRDKARSVKPLRQLLPFVWRYPFIVTLFLIFLTVATVMNLAISFAARIILDCGLVGDKEIPENCLRYAIGDGGNMAAYFKFALIIALVLAISGALRFYFISVLGQRVIADLRKDVYNKLTTLRTEFYERIHTGEVLSRLTTDTTLIETIIGSSFSFALRHIAFTIGAIVIMFFIDWKLTLLVLSIGPLVLLPVLLVGRRIRTHSRDSQNQLAGASSRASESLSAMQTVQAFTREAKERRDFSTAVEATFTAHKKRIAIRSLMTFLMTSLGLAGIVVMIWYGAVVVGKANNTGGQSGMSGGTLTQFGWLGFQVISSIGFLIGTWTDFLRASGATERVMELLEEDPKITAPDAPVKLNNSNGALAFASVTFAYPSRPTEQALQDVSFSIEEGETIALVGPSGAGKSTIFQLLLRFYDVNSGQISVDDVNIDKLSPQNLREQFAIVQQNTPLFSGSAMDNIRYGREGASDAEVISAAKAAFAHEFIEKLPEGYATDLGESAVTLSGGQRQRLAIARAILRDAPVLLLDEATSALDAESERAVQKAFEEMSKTKTTLVIAHRLATVLKADRIIVMDKGQIAETGTHKTLIEANGLYARLAQLQFDTDQFMTEA